MMGLLVREKHAENAKNLVSFTDYLLKQRVDGVF